MNRTQVHLTPDQTSSLLRWSHLLNQGKSELIRSAIDEYLARCKRNNNLKKLHSTRGMWSNNKNILDIRKLRSGFDRF
jgi:hypothetical protein